MNEAGNGGLLDLTTGEILVGGVGGIGLNGNVKNRLNWAPRLGATYQLDEKTVLRAGYGRSYDIGVFGSLFGHTRDAEPAGAVDAGAERAEQLRRRVQPRAGAAGAGVPGRAGERPVPAAERRRSRARCRRSSGRRRSTRSTSPCSIS